MGVRCGCGAWSRAGRWGVARAVPRAPGVRRGVRRQRAGGARGASRRVEGEVGRSRRGRGRREEADPVDGGAPDGGQPRVLQGALLRPQAEDRRVVVQQQPPPRRAEQQAARVGPAAGGWVVTRCSASACGGASSRQRSVTATSARSPSRPRRSVTVRCHSRTPASGGQVPARSSANEAASSASRAETSVAACWAPAACGRSLTSGRLCQAEPVVQTPWRSGPGVVASGVPTPRSISTGAPRWATRKEPTSLWLRDSPLWPPFAARKRPSGSPSRSLATSNWVSGSHRWRTSGGRARPSARAAPQASSSSGATSRASETSGASSEAAGAVAAASAVTSRSPTRAP
ncbi:hypothetical protein SAMN06297387_12668 [Streptomyces zhaozhouensis]|uniref:Uncharacterized protein n=1 Tax=Streptomyces zhaozhouensis TaxID=1300267 RepID=A0A286E6V9_9ACTN|nr:hypothetical protein SAMN06297387_12668 [Streptomyces zhaozhouensis]